MGCGMQEVVGRGNGKWRSFKAPQKQECKKVRMIKEPWIKMKELEFKLFDQMAFLGDKSTTSSWKAIAELSVESMHL